MIDRIKSLYFNEQVQLWLGRFSTPLPERWCRVAFYGLLLLGVILRFCELYFEPGLSRDSIDYVALAVGFAEGGNDFLAANADWTLRNPPFLWGIMKRAVQLGINAELAGRFICMTLGAALPMLFYWLAKLIFTRKEPALWVMGIAACHAGLINLSAQILRDIPFMFFAVLFVCLFYICLGSTKRWHWVVAGGALGVALTCRYEALELFVLPLAFWPYVLWRKNVKIRDFAILLVLFAFGVLGAVAAVLAIIGMRAELFIELFRNLVGRYW